MHALFVLSLLFSVVLLASQDKYTQQDVGKEYHSLSLSHTPVQLFCFHHHHLCVRAQLLEAIYSMQEP